MAGDPDDRRVNCIGGNRDCHHHLTTTKAPAVTEAFKSKNLTTMTNLEKVTKENKLMGTAAHLGGLINKMKRLNENRPTYPTELLPMLVKADFDRKRIAITDLDLGDSYCRICVEDQEQDWETNEDHAWIDVPVLWFEEATADYMKEIGIWDEYRPEDEYLISDWLQCNLHDWDQKVIVDTVFQRVLDDVFKNIEKLPV